MTTHTIATLFREETDSRVFFKRPDNTIFAVLSPDAIRELKRKRQLDNFLRLQRESGVVIRAKRA